MLHVLMCIYLQCTRYPLAEGVSCSGCCTALSQAHFTYVQGTTPKWSPNQRNLVHRHHILVYLCYTLLFFTLPFILPARPGKRIAHRVRHRAAPYTRTRIRSTGKVSYTLATTARYTQLHIQLHLQLDTHIKQSNIPCLKPQGPMCPRTSCTRPKSPPASRR